MFIKMIAFVLRDSQLVVYVGVVATVDSVEAFSDSLSYDSESWLEYCSSLVVRSYCLSLFPNAINP